MPRLLTYLLLLCTLAGFLLAPVGARADDTPAPAPPPPAPALPVVATPPTPQAPPAVWARQQIAVARADVPPVIDGDLSDPAWRTATHASGFYRFGGGAPLSEQTEAWICADANNLYVAFHCFESQPERIQTNQTQRGGDVNSDDHVTIDIDSQGTRTGVSTFQVSANGTQSEYLEGGTTDNITWAGDWKAAARRVKDGWNVEVAIPFRLLRYPKGTCRFGIFLYRRLARETNSTVWPYVPPAGASDGSQLQYLNDFTGIAPPFFAPRPVILPYVLASAGDGDNSVREGVDIKYPLTTSLTGLAAIRPDFKTVEQSVASINFSYNEKGIDDRRPFFAEGRNYLPGGDLFYSPRIGQFDEGIKIAGKDGANSVGLLGVLAQNSTRQQAAVFRLQHDIGLFSNVGFSAVGDSAAGATPNRVVRGFGSFGGQYRKTYQWNVHAQHTQTWERNRQRGDDNALDAGWYGTKPGAPGFHVGYDNLAPDFTSNLGLLADTNRSGYSVDIQQGNQFDRGAVGGYYWDLSADTYNRYDGSGFFHNDVSAFSKLVNRRGFGGTLYAASGLRRGDAGVTYHDRQVSPGVQWNQKSIYNGGDVSYSIGRQAGQRYRFLNIDQNVPVAHKLTISLNYARQTLGRSSSAQYIATGTYRLSELNTISARILRQDVGGSPAPPGQASQTNLYVAYGRRSRRGADLFIIVGDPNAVTARAQVTVKVVRPY